MTLPLACLTQAYGGQLMIWTISILKTNTPLISELKEYSFPITAWYPQFRYVLYRTDYSKFLG